MQSFECSDLPDFHPGIVTDPWSIEQGDAVAQLPQRTPFDTPVNRHPQSPADSLVDLAQGPLTDCDQLSQSLDNSLTDPNDNSLDILLPELPKEMEQVQLTKQFHLFIYLLYLTLVYKIVKNNSTNKYKQH